MFSTDKDSSIMTAAEELYDLKIEEKRIKERISNLTHDLDGLTGHSDIITGGYSLKWIDVKDSLTFDSKKFSVDHPKAFKKYQTKVKKGYSYPKIQQAVIVTDDLVVA